MRNNVAQLLKSPTGATRHYELEEDIGALDQTLKPLTALYGAVELVRTTDGILVRASLLTTVELTCSRCLDAFSHTLRLRIEEEFLPTVDIMTGARLPIPDDADVATLIDAHHILDLTEIVRQSLLLALPPFPLCRKDCKGLCPHCGQNWNEGPCDCHAAEPDPRLAILKQLLDE